MTLCDDGPVVSIQNETAARGERHNCKFRRKANGRFQQGQSGNAADRWDHAAAEFVTQALADRRLTITDLWTGGPSTVNSGGSCLRA